MENKTSFRPESLFPTKASLKPLFKQPHVAAVSNHFAIETANSQASVSEWHMSFIRQDQLADLERNFDAVDKNAIATDSRALIEEVLLANKRHINRKLGLHFTSGSALFTTKAASESRAIFSEHKKFVLICEVKNRNLSLDSMTPNHKSRQNVLRVLNTNLKSIFKGLKFLEFGMNCKFYDQSKSVKVSVEKQNFIVMKGFKTAFELYEGGIKLMVDYSTRIIRADSLWTEITNASARNTPMEDIINNNILGKSFITTYGNQKIIRIDEVDLKGRITQPFPDPNFKSYADYFQKKYKCQLTHKDQFVLIHNKKIWEKDMAGQDVCKIVKERYFPELVRPLGLTDAMRADFRIMKELSNHTMMDPENRFAAIHTITSQINDYKNKNFDFKIIEKSNKVSAVNLPTPKIIFANQSSTVPVDGRINVTSLAESKSLTNWALVYDAFSEQNLDVIMSNFSKVSGRFKVKFTNPDTSYCVDNRPKVLDIFNFLSNKCPKLEMVLFAVTRRTAQTIYRDVKKQFNRKGILTQFFVSFNANKDTNGLSKYSNILLQMLNKTGCNLWYINRSLKNSMVLGADVYHARGNKSVASVVSCFDDNFKKSFSTSSIQKREYQEIIDSVAKMVFEHVENYQKVKKILPESIVFYRDGVGEGMVNMIVDKELKKIIELLDKKFGNSRPKIMLVMVTKRIDDRFALAGNCLKNPEPGFMVYKDVVKGERANFFLVAQKVTQGTANPTHYEIVYNELSMSFDDIVGLTYDLTWNYYNWMGPVKVPAPVQYAHKLCALNGELQDSVVSDRIRSLKYYM